MWVFESLNGQCTANLKFCRLLVSELVAKNNRGCILERNNEKVGSKHKRDFLRYRKFSVASVLLPGNG